MRKIAIITGATGGLGQEFVRQICSENEAEEIWAVGRNREKLDTLKAFDARVQVIEADLAADGMDILRRKLKENAPEVRLLINNAGVGYMGPFKKMSTEQVESICRLNCSVPSELIADVLPYMHEGAAIINISSASSFQPNPYLAVYSASKVYLRNLSRALSVELKPRKISVTCVCPGWVDTGMLPRKKDGKKIRYTGMIRAERVVKKALRDSAKKRDMSVPGWFARYFRFYSKITPTKLVMKQWTYAIRKYI
ncbi:MAG: SDR family NAD(P)-dependent oxidoreductase [Lachnospiraceae bacterium]|nr:SDR family NAD(P)-dependent oxidoreductase [Lachnospiraceae bacterium]